MVETCDANDPTQSGWSYSSEQKVVTGPGGLCLDNRTQTYRKAILPQPENGQFQLRECDGSAFQQFFLNTTAVAHPDHANAGVLQSNEVPKGNSSRIMPGSCSDGANSGVFPCLFDRNLP